MYDNLIEELEERIEELERDSKLNWCMFIHLNKELTINNPQRKEVTNEVWLASYNKLDYNVRRRLFYIKSYNIHVKGYPVSSEHDENKGSDKKLPLLEYDKDGEPTAQSYHNYMMHKKNKQKHKELCEPWEKVFKVPFEIIE